MADGHQWVDTVANVCAIGAALAAALTLKCSADQFRDSVDLQQELVAVSMFSEYAKQRHEVAKRADAFPMLVQHTAETIFRFRRGDLGWQATAQSMINDNREALLSVTDWHCDTFEIEFYDMLLALVPELCCDKRPPGRTPPKGAERCTEPAQRSVGDQSQAVADGGAQ